MPSGIYIRTPQIVESLKKSAQKRGINPTMFSPEANKKKSDKRKGMKFDLKWRENISKGHLGQTPWNKDKKLPNFSEEKSGRWSGDDVGYRGIHHWVVRHLGKPTKCVTCGKDGLTGRQIHWANLNGEYKRNLNDWIRLCAKCHGIFDKINKLRKNSR